MPTIPHLIPVADGLSSPVAVGGASAMFSTYDIAIGGLGFRLASDADKPMIWQTAEYKRDQIDQASEPGEQSLNSWWLKSQSSFHGGAGQLNLERVDLPSQYTHIRFDKSKNVNVWTPGMVTRLPDTTLTAAAEASCAVATFGDLVVYADATGDLWVVEPTAVSPSPAAFTAVTEAITSLCTDGERVFAAGSTGVWKVDPTDATSGALIATYPASASDGVVGWVKSRLMLAVSGTVYELDSNAGAAVALVVGGPETRYTHPTAGWTWRCFAVSPASILAAGDAGGSSEIIEFTLAGDGSMPVLTVGDTAATLPPGERVLCMENTMGTFLALGTTAGLRIGQFGTTVASPAFNYGPLTLPPTETQFAVSALACRDRFVYAGGLAVDEPGLICVDLATQTDQSGRYAWATDLIPPSKVTPAVVTALVALPSSRRLLFSAPGVGLCLEGAGPGEAREAYLQTSRIRYGTIEPKLFKLGSVRGTLTDAAITVQAFTRTADSTAVRVGFTTADPGEFALPAGGQEWLALRFTLEGADCVLSSYGVKALPGTRRQRMIQVTCTVQDRETDRNGHPVKDVGSARGRVEALFDLDAAGDEVMFEEYGIYTLKRTVVVIERVLFTEASRPTKRSDFGGQVTVTMRTVS